MSDYPRDAQDAVELEQQRRRLSDSKFGLSENLIISPAKEPAVSAQPTLRERFTQMRPQFAEHYGEDFMAGFDSCFSALTADRSGAPVEPPTTATPTTSERVSLFDRIQEAKTITLSKCDNAGCNQNHPCRSCELILNTLNQASIHARAANTEVADLTSTLAERTQEAADWKLIYQASNEHVGKLLAQLTALQEAVAQVRTWLEQEGEADVLVSEVLSRLPASPVETEKP